MLERIVQNWHPKKAVSLIVLVTLNQEGHLVSSEIFQSSGSKKSDKEASAAVQQTEFAPLPDWYKGEQLTFKIELSKVEALQQ
jgi:TonB family protein